MDKHYYLMSLMQVQGDPEPTAEKVKTETKPKPRLYDSMQY